MRWQSPILIGEMVRLRPIAEQDADALWESVNDAEGMTLIGQTREFTRSEIDDWAQAVANLPGRFDWAVTSPAVSGEIPVEDSAMIGEVSLIGVDERAMSANLRSASLPGHRGRGYGREAVMLVLEYAFEGLGLHRVGLDVLSINPRAAALYSSLGFLTEGRRREAHVVGERRCDVLVMGMLMDDYILAKSQWR